MVFSSAFFLCFFLPLFLLVYFLLPHRWKNAWALLASVLFYAWGAPLFVFVLLGAILFDFYLVRFGFERPNRKSWLILGVLVNVGLLAYFKYANFFVDNVNALLATLGFAELEWTKVVLPIGISFFTFQKISYLVDVYRQDRPPLQKLRDHALYVILFPQLIAGPIVRYNEIADQLHQRWSNINADNRLLGFFRFCIGLGKKALIANTLGRVADASFALDPQLLTATDAWYGALAYTFQIYFDFSAYSDMAIGLGLMMGFRFPENFNNPYIAQSITDFWRRWHITLSNWMRDYLYIPLGGNRVSEGRLYVNLALVFLISGFWHGAAWTFVFWGAYHGFWLIAERLFLLKIYKRIPRLIQVLWIFLLALIGWVFFRAPTLDYATDYLSALVEFSSFQWRFDPEVHTTLVVAALICAAALYRPWERAQMQLFTQAPGLFRSLAMFLISIFLLITSLSFILASGYNPFIYFQF